MWPNAQIQKNAKYVEVCGNHKKPSEMAKQFKIVPNLVILEVDK